MFNFQLNKKQIIVFGILGALMAVYCILVGSVFSQNDVLQKELKSLEKDLGQARGFVNREYEQQGRGQLVSRRGISYAIRELTHKGRSLNINFLAISPMEIEKMQEAPFSIFPLQLELEASYKDMGIFLGELERLEKSLVSIRSFNIKKHDNVFSVTRVSLIVEMYLEDSESAR